MRKHLTEKELDGMWSFLVETFRFTEEQNTAIHHQIPMTQELYDSILDRCNEIGEEADRLFYAMLKEYPDFMTGHVNRIDEEVAGADIPLLSKEASEKMRHNIHAQIKAMYGEESI